MLRANSKLNLLIYAHQIEITPLRTIAVNSHFFCELELFLDLLAACIFFDPGHSTS